MPLIKSASKSARSQNISEMVRAYKDKGSIGNTKPKNMKHALKIAAAAAYNIQRNKKK